jgi:hypothetical protein
MNEKLKDILILIAEIAGLFAVFIVFLLVLNFFNILSLSKIYPNQLGFLPHLKTTTTSNNQSQMIKNNPLDIIPVDAIPIVSCPIENCKNAVTIGQTTQNSSQEFSGLGFPIVSTPTAVFARIKGAVNIQNITENGQNVSIVTITASTSGNLKIVYKFSQSDLSIQSNLTFINQYLKLAELKAGSKISYQNTPYSFTYAVQDPKTNNYFRLTSFDNGRVIRSLIK